jgi:hypothetical protein
LPNAAQMKKTSEQKIEWSKLRASAFRPKIADSTQPLVKLNLTKEKNGFFFIPNSPKKTRI